MTLVATRITTWNCTPGWVVIRFGKLYVHVHGRAAAVSGCSVVTGLATERGRPDDCRSPRRPAVQRSRFSALMRHAAITSATRTGSGVTIDALRTGLITTKAAIGANRAVPSYSSGSRSCGGNGRGAAAPGCVRRSDPVEGGGAGVHVAAVL